HQINNPLTTIMGDAELILQEMDESNPWHDGLKAIYRAGRRAHNVVKRLLSTARRGNPGEAPQRIDVHETIYNTLELVTTHIEHIVDAFFTTKTIGEGTGLGLYICKQILLQCEGTIHVEAVENTGTCFLVSLPVEM